MTTSHGPPAEAILLQPTYPTAAAPIKREDHALLCGRAQFTADVPLTEPLHVSFARSVKSCGQLRAIDTTAALQCAGVFAVHTGDDVRHLGELSVNAVMAPTAAPPYPILACDAVTAVGQPLAAALADQLSAAQCGAEMVHADIGDASPARAVVARERWHADDCERAFEQAAHVVECEIMHARLAPSPLEPRGIAIEYHPDTDCATIWHSTQTPHRSRSELAAMLAIDARRLRVVARHVGGAFGMKGSLYPEEVFCVWAAFHHRRSVRWIASRAEDFLSATHGRGIRSRAALAIDGAGRALAVKADIVAPIGPWLPNSGLIPAWNAARILPTGYRIDAVDITTTAAQDGRGPTGIYRGAGRPEANLLMERLIDKAAAALDADPLQLRLRNLLCEDDLPRRTACGQTLDSGHYPQVLERLLEVSDYRGRLQSRDQRRSRGELIGLGVAFYVEPSGSGWETADVTLHADGAVSVASGSSSQGHARETSYAMIASAALGIDARHIDVTLGDTATAPAGIGALASRSTAIGGSAVLAACNEALARRRAGEALPLTARQRYENSAQAWGYGACLAQLRICADTGLATIEGISCVDDAGRLISPALAHGQIVGGVAQGIGEAMMERVVYDDSGQLLTGSLMDYAVPRARDMPPLQIDTIQTPSPTNLLGAKGLGEAGTIGAPAAILNAAVDALRPLGVTDLQMPLTSQSLWQTIVRATREMAK